MKKNDILMAEAVVRVMREFRYPLEERGQEDLFDAFQQELEEMFHSPEGTKHVSEMGLPLNDQGNPLLHGKLRDRYLDICRELDVAPTGKEA